MNRCPFLLPPCGFFEFYKTGIVKDIVIALKRDLYRKGGEEISGEDRFLDSPRFFFLSFKRYYYRRNWNRIPMSWTSDFLFENICTHVWKKGKRRGEGKRKEKKKEKECRSSTYDAAVNRLMAMQKGRQGSNIARHSVCCIILK